MGTPNILSSAFFEHNHFKCLSTYPQEIVSSETCWSYHWSL